MLDRDDAFVYLTAFCEGLDHVTCEPSIHGHGLRVMQVLLLSRIRHARDDVAERLEPTPRHARELRPMDASRTNAPPRWRAAAGRPRPPRVEEEAMHARRDVGSVAGAWGGGGWEGTG